MVFGFGRTIFSWLIIFFISYCSNTVLSSTTHLAQWLLAVSLPAEKLDLVTTIAENVQFSVGVVAYKSGTRRIDDSIWLCWYLGALNISLYLCRTVSLVPDTYSPHDKQCGTEDGK